MDSSQEIVACTICDDPTPMLGTKLCDRCWELEGKFNSLNSETARAWLARKIDELRTAEDEVGEMRLDRVLDRARDLADIDTSSSATESHRGFFQNLQVVAQYLSALTSAIREYDELPARLKAAGPCTQEHGKRAGQCR